MATDPRYPGCSSRLKDGKVVWRYRGPGRYAKQITLPGLPDDAEFAEAYHAASRKHSVAEILNMPGRALPRTFGKASRLLQQRDWWVAYDTATQYQNMRFIERFLEKPVDPDKPALRWLDVPVEYAKRANISEVVMAIYADTPHAGRHYFNAIKKLFKVAFEEEWIKPENDPCLSIKLAKPKHVGQKAWSDDAMANYEARHLIGSSARTCYEIAKWIGNRRGDIARLNWDQLVTLEMENEFGDIEFMDAFDFNQQKNSKRMGGKHMVLPVTDKFAAALAPLKRQMGKTVLQRFDGEPYSINSLTGQMAVWTQQAGLPAGNTLHGLRKNFAQYLVRAKADIVAIRDLMGHSSLTVTQVYLAGIKQEDSALEARNLINQREAKRDAAKRRANLRIVGGVGT